MSAFAAGGRCGRPDGSDHRAGITSMRRPPTAAGGAAPAGGGPAQGQARPAWLARLRAGARLAPDLARGHWTFTTLLAGGLVLRLLAQIAYRPALLYIDSTKYLLNNSP